jgi:hypothetical protein
MAMLTSFKYGNNRPNVSIGPKVRFFLESVHFLHILTIIFMVISML